MKKIRLLLIFALLASTLTVQAQRQRVSVSVQNATVGSVIEQLERQTGLDFFFGNAQVDVNRRVSLNIQNGELDAAVRQLLGTGFTPEYDGNVVVIRPADTTQQTARTAHGKVVDDTGRPVVGASVMVVGVPGRGTSTDAQGNWVLSVQGLINPRLVVQFMGMRPAEFAGTPGMHNIKLEQNVIQTEAAVVSVSTGYQDIPRDRMTGAHQTVTASELENSTFASLDQALAGKVSGLYVATTSGQPGVQAELRIRGDNSISGIREPLWIVDGLPLQEGVASIKGLTSGDLQQSILNHGVGNISPADIESVTILKDAAATAIYGARAAAGVIVVKTRAGTPGKVRISYRGNFALGTAPEQKLGFMNSSQKIDFETQLAEQFSGSTQLGTAGKLWNQLQRGEISHEAYDQTIGKMRSTNTNWFDEIYRTSFSHSHNVSVSGGSEKLTVYGSLNAVDEKGVLKSNRFNTFSGMLKMSYRPGEKFLADFSLDAAYRESNNHNSAVDPFKYAVFANPYETADGYDTSWLGNQYNSLGEGTKYETFNILNELDNTGEKSVASDITATLRLNYQIRPWLKAEAYGRIGYANSLTERWADKGTYGSYNNYMLMQAFLTSSNVPGELPAEYNRGYMSGSTARTPSYSMRAGLSANHTFGNRHHVNGYVGSEVRSAESWVNSFHTAEYDALYQFTGFPEFGWLPDMTTSMSNSLNDMAKYVYGNKDRYASFYGAFTYSFDDRYVFNANARFDGAGTIHSKNRFTPLWSASVRWNLHNENFLKNNVSWIGELAVRGVFGYTGQIDKTALPFAWMQLSPNQYDGEYYTKATHFANPGIKWERKQERSIGLDYSLFKNVFGGSVNYYNNKTRDLLDRATVANSFGNTTPRINKGSLTNRGLELNFNLRLRIGEVRWLTSFNIARNTNKITDTYYKAPWEYETETIGEHWRGYTGAIEGYAVGTSFGYEFAGVNPETGNAMIYLSDRARQALRDAGLTDTDRWDTEADPMIDGQSTTSFLALSLTNIGNSSPKYYGGFGTTVQWRNWELSGSFTYATGRMLPTFDERSFGDAGELTASRLNRLATAANRWRAPGDVTEVARYTTGQSNYSQMNTSDRYEKADYLSFNDLSLSYTFAERLAGKIGMTQARLGFQIQNLATWSRYSGFDATSGGPFSYPRQRRYVLNLQLSF